MRRFSHAIKIACIVRLAAIAIVACAGFAPLHAEDIFTYARLCAQPWEMSRPAAAGVWERVRAFHWDGTFTTQGQPGESGKWVVSGNKVALTFSDGTTESIALPLDPFGSDGIATDGQPMDVVQLTPEPPPVKPEVQQKASDIVSAFGKDLVIISGNVGDGSGFIANFGKSKFLFTNIHVIAGVGTATFQALDGTKLVPTSISSAADRDVFCLGVNQAGAALELMQDVDKEAAPGDDVVVLGNADGQGVVNTLIGKLLAINADTIEVNAPFIPGNSGSPIIHLKTGKVIGIATFHDIINYDAVEVSKGQIKPIIRRYGYRLDNVNGWQAVEWRSFYAQSTEMEKIEGTTEALADLLRQVEANTPSASLRSDDPVVGKCILLWQEARSSNYQIADRAFASSVQAACQTDIAAARLHIGYAFFLHKLADQVKKRDEILKEFQKTFTKWQ
ncbi:MAG TPA: serine protease [Chthoniobacteraceae bacterium]|nr:serine protease [Chthoniobacteraceae bacterium]